MYIYRRQLRNSTSERWIKDNTLPCPKCRSPIAKNGGCDRVKCSQCSHLFFWSHFIYSDKKK